MVLLSGFYIKCFGGVMGLDSEIIKTELENFLTKRLSCRKAIELIVRLLKSIRLKENKNTLEIFWFSKENSTFENSVSCNLLNEGKRVNKII
jgi:20S proteasome alpha/beta subunit